MPYWECFLCAKKNDESEKYTCVCCNRPRDFAPKSYINKANAQPLALHGIATDVFPFRVEQIDALVNAGLDLGAKDTTGWTALHCAARTGDSNVVVAILEKQPSKELIEATTQGGWRALHHAVAYSHLGVVEELLAADAEVDARIEQEGAHAATSRCDAWARGNHGLAIAMWCESTCDDNGIAPHSSSSRRYILHDDMTQQRLLSPAITLIQNMCAVGAAQIGCARMLLAKARDLIVVRDAEGMSPYQQAQLLPASNLKEQLIKPLELNQHPLERMPLLGPFLRDVILHTG